MSSNIQISFESSRFAIERGYVLLIRVLGGPRRALLTTTGESVQPGMQDLLQIINNGSVSVSFDGPGRFEGMLFGLVVRRSSDGTTFQAGMSPFSFEVTDQNWRSGVAVVDMDSYREVVLSVHERDGRPVAAGTRLGMTLPGKEGGIDFVVDDEGEARFFLPPGLYGTQKIPGPRVCFEITSSLETQTIAVPAFERESESDA